jgi:hypothetical protein
MLEEAKWERKRMLTLEKFIVSELMENIACVDKFLQSWGLLTFCGPELAAFNALYLKDDPGTGVPFLGSEVEVAFDHFTGKIKLFVKVDGEVYSRFIVAH